MKPVTKLSSVFIALLLLFSSLTAASAITAQTTLEEWTSQYESLKTDTSVITLIPGGDESDMNFAWLSVITDFMPKFKISKNADMSGAAGVIVKTSPTLTGNLANKATASDLDPNTIYFYSYTEKGIWSSPESFKTGGGSDFKAIFVSDPQMGRSGDEKLDEVLLRDSFGWNAALESAFNANPDANFILSAGDQVNTATVNAQYNLLLAPELLRNIPFAAAMGNHDFTFPLYKYHYNNPNEFKGELIESLGGSGFWFTYGQALFVVLNSNMPLPGNQELLLKQAVDANPDALWRVVMMHNSIYGAGGGVAGPVNLWRSYAGMFDKYSVDLVLSGHDHVHCRTYPIKDNKIVGDGKGVVYLAANSGSGSKYSGAPETAPWYAASCSQLHVPSYSVLAFEEGRLTLNTYRTDTSERIDTEYVMAKQTPTPPAPEETLFVSLLNYIKLIVMVIQSSFSL